ncbi:Peptidase C10 family protein [Flammeovirgaceae bacterium 311]|nr:Peptidase C10 family protein [Flammeovirgaceae bacterium 311]
MRNLFLLIAALWCSTVLVQARQVPVEDAQLVALHYLQLVKPGANLRTAGSLQLAYQEVSKTSAINARTTPLTYFYVFNIGENGGMIFVAGDDKVTPILGYTDAGSYDPKRMPPHFTKWLEYYKNEIRYAIQSLPQNEALQKEWTGLLKGTVSGTKAGAAAASTNGVNPLIASKWDQSPFYNQLCPYDDDARDRAVTGCVATAMAQIMRYWEYPAKGSGFHSYNHERYGTLTANFSNTTYDWANMPMELNGNNTAVATLMQHVGISVDMNYDIAERGGSGAYVVSDASPVQHCSEYALKTYFGYKDVRGVQRADYTQSAWIDLLKQQLSAGQPVLYAGFGSGGGHAFVCDGYTDNNLFHMNWGWGGYADGYFAITALDPEGGGTGGFNSGHQAVIDIRASETPVQTAELQLYDNVSLSASSIYYTQEFSLHTNIINKGNSSFKGDYAAAAFDEEGNLVEFIQTYTNNELPSDYYYIEGVTFSTEGMVSLLPGRYTLAVLYKPLNGEWQQLSGSGYTSAGSLEVVYPNDLELGSAFKINNGADVYSNAEVTVEVAIKNDAAAAFNGVVDVSLYNLDGSLAYTIEEKENVSICAKCKSPAMSFSNNSVAVEPGTYLVAVLFHASDASEWDLAGSSYFTNPVKVIVKTAPLAGDAYENNDDPEFAYLLPLTYSSQERRVATIGSNIHIGTDYDFYKFEIPADGLYTMKLRVHDSYNSTDANTYSNDVLFSYSTDGENWSDVYDDVMPAAIELEGGEIFYVFVASYFQGETGSYSLEAAVRQTRPNGVDDDHLAELVEVYPNPTSGQLSINMHKPIDSLELLSMSGQVLKQAQRGAAQLDISGLPNGMYLVRVRSGADLQVKKVIKQ